MNFIDYRVNSPREELCLAFQGAASEKYSSIASIEGRLVCVMQMVVHIAGIVLKPLYYLGTGILGCIVVCISKCMSQEDTPREFAFLVGNPDLQARMRSSLIGLILTAPFAILSQIIQVVKATLGVLHPGIYFRLDELAPYFQRLAAIARAVECPEGLIDRLERGSEIAHASLHDFPNSEYFEAEYQRDLPLLVNQLENNEIPDARKLSILMMLNPEPAGSGIEACPGALGRILRQMRINLEVSEDPTKILTPQVKEEIINEMVLQSSATEGQPGRPAWHHTIFRLAHDDAHRGNALILQIGRQIQLPESTIIHTEHDPTVVRLEPLEESEHIGLLAAFEGMLLARVNSGPDGSPGLKTFRDQVIQSLVEHLPEGEAGEEDPAIYVTQRYYLNGGRGDPSEPGFNDLNIDALNRFENF